MNELEARYAVDIAVLTTDLRDGKRGRESMGDWVSVHLIVL